MIDDKDE